MKTTLKRPVAIVGYSGHAYVIIDIFLNAGRLVTAYCDSEEKSLNPYHLNYLGKESEVINKLKKYDYFACVGHNGIREKIHTQLSQFLGNPLNAIHPSAVVSASVKMSDGIMIAANVTINRQNTCGRSGIESTWRRPWKAPMSRAARAIGGAPGGASRTSTSTRYPISSATNAMATKTHIRSTRTLSTASRRPTRRARR